MVIGYISIFNRISNTKPTLEHQRKTKKKLGRHSWKTDKYSNFSCFKKKKSFSFCGDVKVELGKQ